MSKPTEIVLHDTSVELPKESIADLVRKMIQLVGEDPNREGLLETPERYAKAMLFFTRAGRSTRRSLWSMEFR